MTDTISMTGPMMKDAFKISERKSLDIKESRAPDGVPVLRVSGVYPFDAASTLDCGQCFRFDKREAEYPEVMKSEIVYGGVFSGRYINVSSPDMDTLIIEGADEEEFERVWRGFFRLDMDYAAVIGAVKEDFGADSRMAAAADAGAGIRILRQEPWETLCSFIISQNNNIPRIKKIISELCRRFGEPLTFRAETHYAFPTPLSLLRAGRDGLAETRMGFRAKYIEDAASRVAHDGSFFKGVSDAPTYEAADMKLRDIKGVGPKVSACTLLFAFERYDAFPVDVWIRRTAGKYFPGGAAGMDFGRLAPLAGILQQYIFNYERNVI